MNVSPSPPYARTDTAAVVLASIALALASLGTCLACGASGSTFLVASQGTHGSVVELAAPVLVTLFLALASGAAGLWQALRRTPHRGSLARVLAAFSILLAIGTFVVPYVLIVAAGNASTRDARDGLRVDDVSAIGAACTMIPDTPRGTCPERYLCINGGTSAGPHCQIVCMGEPAYCGGGSHCDGTYCVRGP